MVETPGVVVACPHCGHHLTTPDFPVETTDDTLVTSPDPPPIDKDSSEDAASSSIFDETPVQPDDSTATEALSNVLLPDPLESPTDPDPSPEVVEPEPIAFVPDPVAAVAEPVASVAEPASSGTESVVEQPEPVPAFQKAEPVGADKPANEQVSRPRRNETVSKRAFLFLLSYASAATLACFWLFYQLQNAPLNLSLIHI